MTDLPAPQSPTQRLLRRIETVDNRLTLAVRENRTPFLDRTLPALSNAANQSKLWIALTAGFMASGDRRLRRAGQRGIMSIVLASAITNAVLKPLLPRPRPVQPVERWFPFVRLPTSSSFPSGHSASAAAFATAVAIEAPIAAIPVGVVAAGVAYSRVFTGVHHPSDVVVGVAVGVGTAALSTRVWSTIDHSSAVAVESPDPVRCDGSTGEGLIVVVNEVAGSAGHQSQVDTIAEALPDAKIVTVTSGDGLLDALEAAAAEAETLGVMGGDGTINAAAKIAIDHDVPLAIFPGGTLNHFARDLGVDSINDAISAIGSGTVVEVDTATIDGRLFLNTASFGVYSDFVAARESLQDRIGKWPASAVALVKVMRSAAPMSVQIDGQPTKVWMIFIGNCAYLPSGFVPATRSDLSDGQLDVRLVTGHSPAARLRFMASMLTGRLDHSPVYDHHFASTISVEGAGDNAVLAADGEIFDGNNDFTIEKSDRRLRVHALPA